MNSNSCPDDPGPEKRSPSRWFPGARHLCKPPALEHALFLPVSFEPVVSSGPDAFLFAHLATALVRAAARPIALILGALGFRAQISDLGQRTIAAIAAVEREHFQSVLRAMDGIRQLGRTLDDLIESLSRPETGPALFECKTMNQAIGFICERRGRRMLFRPQVIAIDIRRAQARRRIGLEIVKLARLGKVKFARKLAPIVRSEGIQDMKDPVVVFQAQMASQVHAPIPEAASDGALLGGKFQKKASAAVWRTGMLFRQGQQFVRDSDAGDLSRVKVARGGCAEYEDIGHNGNLKTVRRHVFEQLVHLPRVVADLIDNESGAGLNLLGQLEILRHDLGFQPLIIRDHGAGEKIAARDFGEELQQSHRIGIEHGRRLAFVAGGGIIAGKGQDIAKTFAREHQAPAHDRIAVPVLT